MASFSTIFDVVTDAIQDEKFSTEGRISVLESVQANVDRQVGVITGQASRVVNSVKNLLGQFSNKSGYSNAELQAAAQAAVEASQSNAAGAAGRDLAGQNTSDDLFSQQSQEAINRFHQALVVDPQNVFVLPRVTYDSMVSLNVDRANALNEANETVGMLKLMRDVIPANYYDSLSLSLLEVAQPQLTEVIRNLNLACGAIATGSRPVDLIETIENDFEAVVRFLGRESIYDSTQFSPTEYLSMVQRLRAAADVIEASTAVIEESKANTLDYQTSFQENFDSSFSECGTLSTAIGIIQSAVDRIEVLKQDGLEHSEALSIIATRELVISLVTALAMIKDFVTKEETITDVLTVQVSTERTLFEASQIALAAIPTLSPTLPGDLRSFANLAERRLDSPIVSPQLDVLFNSIAAEVPVEFANCESMQAALNSYSVNLEEPNKSLVVSSIKDIKELGLDRLLDAILTGDLTISFDTSLTRASRVGFAIQEVSLAIEGAISGVSEALGACKISNRYSAKRLSNMLAELQARLQAKVFAQIGVRDALTRRLRTLKQKELKRLCRYLEEIQSISLAEGCV